MLFYRAVDADGRLQLRGTQAEIKDVNKDFDTWEFPSAKADIQAVLQDLIDRAEAAPKVPNEETKAAMAEADEIIADRKDPCPKCGLRPKAAQVIADMRVNDLFAGELDMLPDRSILRANEIITERLFEIARRAQAVVETEDAKS